jgi:hypothetical protein
MEGFADGGIYQQILRAIEVIPLSVPVSTGSGLSEGGGIKPLLNRAIRWIWIPNLIRVLLSVPFQIEGVI